MQWGGSGVEEAHQRRAAGGISSQSCGQAAWVQPNPSPHAAHPGSCTLAGYVAAALAACTLREEAPTLPSSTLASRPRPNSLHPARRRTCPACAMENITPSCSSRIRR